MTAGRYLVILYFALLHGLVAAVVGFGVFLGLPNRWWVVDVPAAIVLVALVAAISALLVRFRHWKWVVRGASYLILGIGLTLVAVLSMTATYLWSAHGYIGGGGALIYFLVIALLAPYLILFPMGQLLWLANQPEYSA